MTNPVAALLLELALKSSLVLTAAFAITGLARRLSAEERHAVWAFALAGLLALPIVSIVGPSVEVPVREIAAAARLEPGSAGAESGAGGAERSEATAAPNGARRLPRTAPAPAAAATGAAAPQGAAAGGIAGRLLEPLAAIAASSPIAPTVLAASIYAAVALLLLAYFAAAAFGVEVSLRKLAAVTDASVLARFEQGRRRLGLRRDVSVKTSRTDCTPWAWGVFRPVVVVPEGFERMSAESQRDAIAHELAHVARLDFVSSLLGCVCCALYWFQPLAWLALRRMARESEHACDDRVLLGGSSRTAYAAQLLDVARTVHDSGRRPMAAAAMAGSSAVSRRIASILALDIRRRAMSKTKAFAASILTAAFVLPLASVQSQEASPPRVGEPSDAEFRALVQKGAADSDELALLVDTYVERGMEAEAIAALADYISRDPAAPDGENADPTCTFCAAVLKTEGMGAESGSEVLPALLAAFDEVESRARTAADGDLLIRLAAISGASGNRNTTGRGTFYLVEGFRLGNLSDASQLDALRFLTDMGWYQEAKALAEQLHDDEASSLYQSPQVKGWITRLDSGIEHRTHISERLLAPRGSFAYSDDVVPLYRSAPAYPPAGLAEKLEATIQLEFTITDRGRTEGVTVVSSTNSLFDDSAVEAVSRWLYAPHVVDGTAVDAPDVQTIIRFVLEE